MPPSPFEPIFAPFALFFAFAIFGLLITIISIIRASQRRKQYVAAITQSMNIIFDGKNSEGHGVYKGREVHIRFYMEHHGKHSYPRTSIVMPHSSPLVVGQTRFVPGKLGFFSELFGAQDIRVPDRYIDENFIVTSTFPQNAAEIVTPQFAKAMAGIMFAVGRINPGSTFSGVQLREIDVNYGLGTVILAGHIENVKDTFAIFDALLALVEALEERGGKAVGIQADAMEYISRVQSRIYSDGNVTPDVAETLNDAQLRYAEGDYASALALAKKAEGLAGLENVSSIVLPIRTPAAAERAQPETMRSAEVSQPNIARARPEKQREGKATQYDAARAVNECRRKLKEKKERGEKVYEYELKLRDLDALILKGSYDDIVSEAERLSKEMEN